MLEITIPTHRKVNGENEKSFTAYVVEVCVNGRTHVVEKRYTEFEELHKQLKKSISTPELPPKRVLKFNSKVLEQRRRLLETYLQVILEGEVIPSCMFRFLDINIGIKSASFDSIDKIGTSRTMTHQPVIDFKEESFLRDNYKSSLPDIVNTGVQLGMYSANEDLCIMEGTAT